MKQYKGQSLNLSYKEFSKILILNGYVLVRHSGDHAIYSKVGVEKHISINVSKPNMMVMRRLLKELEQGNK